MRSRISSWNETITKLGFKRKKRKVRKSSGFDRKLRGEGLEDRRMMAVLTVDSYSDNTTQDSELTLREAVAVVNGATYDEIEDEWYVSSLGRILSEDEVDQMDLSPDGLGTNDEIVFDASLQGSITLTQSAMQITNDVVITGNLDGAGLNKITISGDETYSILSIGGEVEVSISNLSFVNGQGVDGGAISISGGDVVIDGCVFSQNNASTRGGAINAVLAGGDSLTIANSSFTANTTDGNGGAIAIYQHSSNVELSEVAISHCEITGNQALGSGGGIHLLSGAGPGGDQVYAGNFSLTDSIISGNQAGTSGGGYTENTGLGGGIFARFEQKVTNAKGSLILERNEISNNFAYLGGGGMRIETEFPSIDDLEDVEVRIQDSTISGNSSQGVGDVPYYDPIGGGGISFNAYLSPEEWRAKIINCTISTNRSRNGGGLELMGAIDLMHSTIANNEAGYLPDLNVPDGVPTGGGGVLINGVTGTRVNDDIPGGPYHENPMPRFTNTIFNGNTHELAEGDDFLHSPGVGFTYFISPDVYRFDSPEALWPDEIIVVSGVEDLSDVYLSQLDPDQFEDIIKFYQVTDFVFEYCLIDDTSGPLHQLAPGSNVGRYVTFANHTSIRFNADAELGPLQDNGGFLLPDGTTIKTHAIAFDSPAYNAGDPGFVPPPQFDQRGTGFDRVVFDRIDIGAYEYGAGGGEQCDSDFDDDFDVDGRDFLIWQRGFGTIDAENSDGDADDDGDVDVDDLACWQEHYGTGTGAPLAANVHSSDESSNRIARVTVTAPSSSSMSETVPDTLVAAYSTGGALDDWSNTDSGKFHTLIRLAANAGDLAARGERPIPSFSNRFYESWESSVNHGLLDSRLRGNDGSRHSNAPGMTVPSKFDHVFDEEFDHGGLDIVDIGAVEIAFDEF